MTSDGPTNPALWPGETYVDYAARFSITTVSTSAAAAQMRILIPGTNTPTLLFIKPTDGSAVPTTGSVPVLIDALDRQGVTKVELYKDDILVGADTQEPYQFNIDMSQDAKGAHVLRATAYNALSQTF